ncbi:hypothetical protein L1049_020399 [Liquidambar formosana]|uniref:Uncharacterized protein n=1 Tax=Liquidambar formosana TaxID=63359 RepID=A0AAP0SDX4_LIQFO
MQQLTAKDAKIDALKTANGKLCRQLQQLDVRSTPDVKGEQSDRGCSHETESPRGCEKLVEQSMITRVKAKTRIKKRLKDFTYEKKRQPAKVGKGKKDGNLVEQKQPNKRNRKGKEKCEDSDFEESDDHRPKATNKKKSKSCKNVSDVGKLMNDEDVALLDNLKTQDPYEIVYAGKSKGTRIDLNDVEKILMMEQIESNVSIIFEHRSKHSLSQSIVVTSRMRYIAYMTSCTCNSVQRV